MPRYYFDIHDDGKLVKDLDGTELPDLAAARIEAAQTIAEIAKDVVPGTVQNPHFSSGRGRPLP